MAVAHILRQKGSDVVTVSPSDSVQSIVDTLSRHRIGAVVVVDGTGASPASCPSVTWCAPWQATRAVLKKTAGTS